MSPTNCLATNPEALQLAIESGGESLVEGTRLFLADLAKGRISMSDDQAFEVGRNLATTPGSVVFENELIQLIQYAPTHAEGPQAPAASSCRPASTSSTSSTCSRRTRSCATRSSRATRCSWSRGATSAPTQGHLDLGRLPRAGRDEGASTSRARSAGADKVNALGFCVGGTLLARALAVLRARGDEPVASLTLLTTHARLLRPRRARRLHRRGRRRAARSDDRQRRHLPGQRARARVPRRCAPTTSIWPYVVNNYLKGKAPPAFDLLYWNADGTNLPGPMYCWYLRNMYLREQPARAGRADDVRRAGRSRRSRHADLRAGDAGGPHRAVAVGLSHARSCSAARRRSCSAPAATSPA